MFWNPMPAPIRLALSSAVSVLVATAGVVTLAPPVASAASYNRRCGPGYSVIDRGDVTGGTVFLTYSRSASKNCVITIRDNPGRTVHMAARVSLAGQPWISDEGQYTTYAGPVYVKARKQCIDWGGEIGSSQFYEYQVHCG